MNIALLSLSIRLVTPYTPKLMTCFALGPVGTSKQGHKQAFFQILPRIYLMPILIERRFKVVHICVNGVFERSAKNT